MKFYKFISLISLIVLTSFLVLSPVCVLAGEWDLGNPVGGTTATAVPKGFGPVVGQVVKAILGLTGIGALILFVMGGFTYLTSAGSPEKVKKGQGTLVWAVIGLVVIFSSYAMVEFILRQMAGS